MSSFCGICFHITEKKKIHQKGQLRVYSTTFTDSDPPPPHCLYVESHRKPKTPAGDCAQKWLQQKHNRASDCLLLS